MSADASRVGQMLHETPLILVLALCWIAGDAIGGTGHLFSPAVPLGCAIGLALALWRRNTLTVRLALTALACVYANQAAYRVVAPALPSGHVALAATGTVVRLEGRLAAAPEVTPFRTRLLLDTDRFEGADGWQPASGLVLITVRTTHAAWVEGTRLRVSVPLRRPRNFGNPGEFDYTAYLARRGIYATAFTQDDHTFEVIAPPPAGVGSAFAAWRRGVGEVIARTLPGPEAAVLSALLIGTDEGIAPGLRAAFNRAGVSHVLSISGLHITLVATVGYAVVRWLLARSHWMLLAANVPKLAIGCSVVPVLFYAAIAGTNVATVRSVVMVLLFLVAVLVDRQRHLRAGLAAAALGILAGAPGASLDIGFQLSFVAVLGLLECGERFWPWWTQKEEVWLLRLRGGWTRLWRPLAASTAVSLAAIAATAPLTAFHFNQVSIVAPVANALVVPLLGSAAVVLGLVAAVLYPLSAALAALAVWVAGPVVGLGIWIVERCANLPGASVRVVTPTVVELGLAYATLVVAVRMSGRQRGAAVAGLLALWAVDVSWWAAERYGRGAARITFLSVGNGDAAVVELPGGEVMVVDGGGLPSDTFDVGERVIAPFLWQRKVRRVDYVVLSHPQWDHYGGLGYVVSQFHPRELWWTGGAVPPGRFERFRADALAQGLRERHLVEGDRLYLGDTVLRVESPVPDAAQRGPNDLSLVLRLAFGQGRVLFAGDVERGAEAALVNTAGEGLRSTVLKVPHHGSRTSSTPALLDAVAPQLAVVSAGRDNRFRFPHPEVVRRYTHRGIALARTDIEGAVTVLLGPDGALSRAQ